MIDTGPMVPREAGTPANDMAPVALLLAAAAILINAWAMRSGNGEGPQQRAAPSWSPLGALLVAGLAMGLALGTKLTIAGGVAAMAVGVIFIVPPGIRRKAFGVFLAGVVATAGFWFLRNLIHSGNPLPWIRDIGPIDLPGPGPRARGPRRLHASPTTSLQTPARASGAPTSSTRSRTCSGRSGS